jgi:hypothetical protein
VYVYLGSDAVTPPVVDTDKQLYTITVSSVLSNLAVADFNTTAFTTAVTSTIAATYSTSGVAVVVDANGVTASTGSRQLQAAATTTSTSVAYTVQHITGSTTAAGMQTLLTSTAGSTALLNSYNANTASTAATAAVVSSIRTSAPGKPKKELKRKKKRSLSDAVIGVIAAFSTVVVAALLWCKRKALVLKCCSSKRQKQLSERPLPEPLETVEPGTRSHKFGPPQEYAYPRRSSAASLHCIQPDRSPVATVDQSTFSTAATPVAGVTRSARPMRTPVHAANFSEMYSSNATGMSSVYNSSVYNSNGTASAASSARTVAAVSGGARSTRSTSRFLNAVSTRARSVKQSVHSFAQRGVDQHGPTAGVAWDAVGESPFKKKFSSYVQFICSVCTT